MWSDIEVRKSKPKRSISTLFGISKLTPIDFHLQVLGNVLKTLDRYDSLFGETAQTLLSSLALSMRFPLGVGTLAFSRVEYAGIWIGVFYDLSKYGFLPSTPGYTNVMAGDIRLSLLKMIVFWWIYLHLTLTYIAGMAVRMVTLVK